MILNGLLLISIDLDDTCITSVLASAAREKQWQWMIGKSATDT